MPMEMKQPQAGDNKASSLPAGWEEFKIVSARNLTALPLAPAASAQTANPTTLTKITTASGDGDVGSCSGGNPHFEHHGRCIGAESSQDSNRIEDRHAFAEAMERAMDAIWPRSRRKIKGLKASA
jgi:hypothetical protein